MLQLKSTPPGRKSILCYARKYRDRSRGLAPRDGGGRDYHKRRPGDGRRRSVHLLRRSSTSCTATASKSAHPRMPVRHARSETRRRPPVGVVGESAREVPQDPTTDLEAARRPCLFTLLRRRESNVGGFVTRSKNAIRLFRLRRDPLHSMRWRIVETRDPLKSCRGECRARQAG